MARSKLLAALDNQNGRDYKLERQKTLQKKAARRKTSKVPVSDVELKENHQTHTDGSTSEADAGDDDTDIDEAVGGISTSRIDDTESESDSSGEPVEDAELDNKEASGKDETAEIDEEDVDEDVPLSQVGSLMSDEENDIVPHQRLTINNTSALQKAHKSFALKYSEIPFCAHQVVTTIEPVAIADVDDDLTRELAFYKQCLDAANKGRTLLKKEGVSFSRPTDYFAEMVKSDEHMGKIKEKMTDEAANKKAAADARKQRDLKKFGKQVQVVKLQERDKAKRETLNKIDILKRKRKNADTGATHEEDLFDVALDDAAENDRSSRSARDAPRHKKRKKDEKFGFGGKKRFAKSTDAASTADMRSFSTKKMKGKKGPQRLGKSRRAKL